MDMMKMFGMGSGDDGLAGRIAEALQKAGAPKFSERDQQKIDQLIQKLGVSREGTTISVPEGIPLDVAIIALTKRRDDEEKVQALTFEFHMTVPEGALALYRTLQELYGIVDPMSQMTLLGESPPEFVSVKMENGVDEMIPMGMLGVPGLEGYVCTSETWSNGIPFFKLVSRVKGKHKSQIHKIVEVMRTRTDSIYKGKAIRLEFPTEDGEATSKGDFFPEFMILQDTDREAVIFDDVTEEVLDVNLYTLITKPNLCRKLGIDTKWGVMLYGAFGVGKTLTATVCANLCKANGRTFIACSIDDLTKAYAFAARHQPAFVFCEDLDQVLQEAGQGVARNAKVSAILESLDGIEAKGVEIITLLTTNNPEIVTKAMLRHGRINAAIELKAPDAKAVRRLIHHYAAGSLSERENIDDICQQLAGRTASVVAAVVEKSRLSAVRHLEDDSSELVITSHDLKIAFDGMASHLKLLETPMPDKRSDIERAATAAASLIVSAIQPQMNGVGLPPNQRDKQHASA